MKKQLVLSTILFALICSFHVNSQIYNFTNYSLEQGIPQSTIFSVYHDSRGYLWIGTESGVARFNGYAFTIYDRTLGLPGNNARSITEGPDGNIWVATDAGIGIFNGREWKKIGADEGLQGSAVIKLVPDQQGRVWAATNDAGVNILSYKGDSLIIENINKDKGLSSNFVLDILHDSSGKTWIAMIGGLNIVTIGNAMPTVYNLGDFTLLPSNLISCIDEDAQGNFWVGTLNAGAFKLHKTGDQYHVIPFNYQKGIDDSRIWDVFCDMNNIVWFGSNENGLYRWGDGHMLNISSKNGLPGNLVLNVSRDRNSNLWVGSMNGLSMFNGFHFVNYTSADGLPGTQVLAVKPGAENSLWVGGDGKGLARIFISQDKLEPRFFSVANGFRNSQVTSIDFDKKGNLLAGTRGDGLAILRNGTFSYLASHDGLADDNINCVYWNKEESVYVGTNMGFNEIKSDKIHTINEDNGLINPEVQTTISDLNGDIWMGTMGGLARFQHKSGIYRDFNEVEGLFDLRIHALAVDRLNQLYIGTSNGIYRYDEVHDTIVSLLNSSLNAKTVNSLLFFNDTILIAGTTRGFNKIYFDHTLTTPMRINSYDKLSGFALSETNLNAICKDSENHVWFGTVNGLTCYKPELEDTLSRVPVLQLTGLRLAFEEVDWVEKGFILHNWFNVPKALTLKHFDNHITFDFDGLYLKNPERVRFRYKLEPYETEWSPPVSGRSATYPGLNNGRYTFSVCASIDGINWSEPANYTFTVAPPFWKTLWFYILLTGGIIAGLIFYIRSREKKLIREKEHLEQQVTLRTAEVVAQKEQIQIQHKIVSDQKLEITSSITYARRIQQAVLPGLDILAESAADSFVLYKPRDIVSGDFYWIGKSGNRLIVSAADCTGHGVPGAFMSMLGISFMNKIIREQKIDAPEVVLKHMRDNVINSMHQGNFEGTTKDGMDMALCAVNLDTLEMTFAGAYNPVIVISHNQISELKANRMPVGFHLVMDDFVSQSIQLEKGDCIYLFSDGFQDQTGGPEGRKFMRKNLRELLFSIHTEPFSVQKQILENTIENWRHSPDPTREDSEQVDDIMVLGFSV